jgi:uncharacterized protein (TIGR02599 family)
MSNSPDSMQTARIPDSARGESAFTLVELLVATGVLALLVALLLNMVTQTSKTWKSTSGKIEQFRDPRAAFDSITRRISQATLNSYLDYNNASNPTAYVRHSELRYLSGPIGKILPSYGSNMSSMGVFFQAPYGFSTNTNNAPLQNVLNTWGYFIEYSADTNGRPGFLPLGTPPLRYRYRLMELMEPTESLSIYKYTSTNRLYNGIDWILNPLASTNRPVHMLAENVVALIILPKLSPADWPPNASHASTYNAGSLAPGYLYDSSTNLNASLAFPDNANLNTHNQLPPVVQVTMISVDDSSAIKFAGEYKNLTNAFFQYGWFARPESFESDLSNCEAFLSGKKISYRVFTTDVMIGGAKFSGSQTN